MITLGVRRDRAGLTGYRLGRGLNRIDWQAEIMLSHYSTVAKLIALSLTCQSEAVNPVVYPRLKSLARITFLPRSIVATYIDQLVNDGWLVETALAQDPPGPGAVSS